MLQSHNIVRGLLLLLCVVLPVEMSLHKFTIDKYWNGEPSDVAPFNITLEEDPQGRSLIMNVQAPYFDDPPPPNANPGEAVEGLYNYEVVEVFFLNDDMQYLEVEISPHSNHYVLLLHGIRNRLRTSLPLEVSSSIDRSKMLWVGRAVIPYSYIPPKVTKFNAFGASGLEPNKRYFALYPNNDPTSKPDFHRLEFFKTITFSRNFYDSTSSLSQVWIDALANRERPS